jgi:hypothetical protein
MNKGYQKKELEEIYFEGLSRGFLSEEFFFASSPEYCFERRLNQAEIDIYGHTLSGQVAKAKAPAKKALKRWQDLKSSPLFGALE